MAKYFKGWRRNQPPVLDLNGGGAGINATYTWTEGDGPSVLMASATVSDADNPTIPSLSIAASGVVDGNSEILVIGGTSFPLGADKTDTGTAGGTTFAIHYTTALQQFDITVSGGGTAVLANWQTLVRGITYDNTRVTGPTDGTRSLSCYVNDGSANSAIATLTLTVVNEANVKPVIDLNGIAAGVDLELTYEEGDGAVTLWPLATVSDVNDDLMTSMTIDLASVSGDTQTVTIGGTAVPLGSNLTTSATVSGTQFDIAFVTATKVFTITVMGGASTAIWQTMLRTITYTNTTVPITSGTWTASVTINDGTIDSDAATLTVNIPSTLAPSLSRVPPKYCARNQTIRSFTVTNTGASGTYSITSGALPTGLSLNTSTGEISGTVGAAATVTTNTIEVTCTNGSGSSAVTFTMKVLGSYVNITSGTTFPYYTNAADRLFVLTENVTADGSGFVFIHSGCVFDLNGYTLTYADKPAVSIANHSFETGTGAAATGWDFTNAPNAVRHAGTWLYNECYDGDYSLKFNNTTLSEYVENTTTVTLEANTYYSVSAMFEYGGQNDWTNPGVKGYVQLIGDGLTTREVSWNQSNYRGIQMQETTFKTGGTSEEYTIRVGIVGHASGTRPFYIDDIRIQQSKANGVVVGPKSWSASLYPELTQYGSAANNVIANGTLTDGTNPAMWGHAIYIENNLLTIHDLDVTVHGHNASCIYKDSSSSFSYSQQIFNNTFHGETTTITTRDYFYGTVLFGVQGNIYNNTITNGCHSGIYIGSTESIATKVYNNTIALKARYTNAFAIVGGRGAEIYDNTINCGTGDYAARGIGSSYGLPTRSAKVYNNTIECQELATNQEYQGISYGVYGIQVESGRYLEVYGNTVTVHADLSVHLAFAFRINEAMAGPVSVHHNTFRLNAISGHGACIKMSRLSGGPFTFEDNTLITNDGLIGASTETGTVSLVRSTITMDTPVSGAYVFETDFSALSTLHSIWKFQDTVFTDANSESRVRAGNVHTQRSYGASYDVKGAAELTWTLSVHAKDGVDAPIADATITATDAAASVEATGQTDGSGNVSLVLREYRRTGSGLVTYTPHDIDGTSGALTGTSPITMDDTKSLELTLT